MNETPTHLTAIHDRLLEHYGEPAPRTLQDPLSELIQTVLSQNTADVNSDRAYVSLMERFGGDWEAVRLAPTSDVADAIRHGGLAEIKAARIKSILNLIVDTVGELDLGFLREAPLDEGRAFLRSLGGVGPKTAACVLLFACGKPALPVDTHVHRVGQRLGLVPAKATAEQAHSLLEAMVPEDLVYSFHMLLIGHGRQICKAQRPRCFECPVKDLCPYPEKGSGAGGHGSGRTAGKVASGPMARVAHAGPLPLVSNSRVATLDSDQQRKPSPTPGPALAQGERMSPELEAALAAARAAGRLQRRRFGRIGMVEMKADDTPITAADHDSERLIRKLLDGVVPGAGFLAEESDEVEGSAEARWIVDPLDGTKKFVRALPFFGPCIALERQGAIALGVMHLPVLGETLWAERGQGAFRNGGPIHVSQQTLLDRAYVVSSSQAEFYRRGWATTLRQLTLGTYHDPGFLDLYSYASLACGRVDAVIDVGDSPWDIAAAQVIIEEAGGRLTDFAGTSTVYTDTTVATNGHLHEALLGALRDCR